MRFDDNADLDTSQISDQRGSSFGGPRTYVAGGGGIIGIIFFLFTVLNGGGGTSGISPSSIADPAQATDLAAQCQTGVDANNKEDCRIVGVVNSVQQYWQTNLPSYQPAQTVFFSRGINTGCGGATTEVGPFYCPADKNVYIDLTFYDELRTQFGATGGPFAEAYVIAHEYGHHVQDQLGVLNAKQSSATGATSASVRTELQADCYAGMWAKGATGTGFISDLTDQDIADALDAASAVGDDRIQQKTQGQVDQESWTHGSSAERQRWFTTGFKSTSRNACDTFNVRSL